MPSEAPLTDMRVMDRDMLIRVLGPVEVVSQGGLAHLGGPKQRAVLAMLTARSGRVVTTDELVDGIWGDDAPAAVSSSIHSYISTLRTIIDQPIERHGSGYVLGVDRWRIDANVFEDTFEQGRKELVTNPSASADKLRKSLALWRGRAYADVADLPGLTDEARRLTDLRLTAVEIRIDADLALGRHAAVVGELEALAAENPFRESFRAKHMLALYRDGRQADALRAYQRTREYLREELGIDPSSELAELEERILNHDYTLIHSREVVSEEVSLLFTEIVDSVLLWDTNPAAARAALARHDHLVQSAIEAAGGTVIKSMGDGFIAAFSEPSTAARVALTAQRAITGNEWSPLDFKVRMAIDTGEVERRGGDLFGPPMNRGSRLLAASHGGQIVLSDDAQKAITRDAGAQVKSLGEHRFKGLGTPQAVHQLLAERLPNNFPPLNIAGVSLKLDRRFGDSIRGYELRERIGRGAFATVYRGYQPSIGREVAIKIVRPEFANHPAFIRRFESEARLVASLEHPHIVSVYDYWRDADGAYIIGPYLAGGSLADATFATMSMTQVIKISSQVGSALSYAHRQGMVHRDVKPANILLDSDGNAYLADFGIAARAVEAITGIQSKSIGYRAPEDYGGEAVGPRADQYGLAAVVARLLTGLPPERLDLSSLDARIRDVLARGLAVDPEARYNTIDEFLDQLTSQVIGTAVPRAPTSHRNPYKGLAAFSQLDASDFFGRSDEIKRLVSMVGENRLSAVVGPSGSGKSSLTLAGLLPALAGGSISESETWISVRAVPGGYPFDELATALGGLSTEPLSALTTELASPDSKGVLRVAKRLVQQLEGELVIVIDQYEELFTLVADESVRHAFATALVTAATDPGSRVRIVLTLRADFFHQVLIQPLLGPIISRVHLALAPLDQDGIRLAIVEPAARAGLHFEPGLPERIVADLKDQPGSLPLLQFTLDRLAVAAVDGLVSDDLYTELGGVKGALAERAEAIFQRLAENQKQAAQQIFTRLLSVSDEADDLRRRVRMSELESLGLPPADLAAVTEAFGKERMLTFDIDPVTRGGTLEVAHEALLREWPTLRDWVDSRRELLVLQRRFQAALGEWEESNRNASNLLTGGKLSQYREWAGAEGVSLTSGERVFLDASIDRASSEAAARRTRRRRITSGYAAVAIIALVLAVVASFQRGQAEENAALAEARELILEAEKNIDVDPELSMLLALEAIETFRESGREPPGAAVADLREGLAASVVEERFPGGRFVAVSMDGRFLATYGEGDVVVVRRIATGEVVATLTRNGAVPIGAAFGSGDLLAVSYKGVARPVRVWSAWSTPDSFVDIGPDETSTLSDVEDVQWGPDGDLVSIGGLGVWSTKTAEMRYPIRVENGGFVSFSGDGRLAFFEDPGEGPSALLVVAANTGSELQTVNFNAQINPLWLSFSPDGARLAIADNLNLAVVDLTTEDLIWSTTALSRGGQPLWLSGGTRLLVGGEGLPAVVDAATGGVIRLLPGHDGGSFSYAQLPGTEMVASAGAFDGETIIFDLGPAPYELGGFTSSLPGIFHMEFVGEGRSLWVHANDRVSSGIIDAHTGETLEYHQGSVTFPIPSANGKYSTGIDTEGRSVLWSNVDGREMMVAPDDWLVRGVSDDGMFAVLSGPSTQLVRTTGGIISELDAGGYVDEAEFSPNGRFVVTSNNGIEFPSIRIWDVSNGTLVTSIGDDSLLGFRNEFTPDGNRLVVGGYDGRINVFDFEKLIAGAGEREAIVRRITAHETFIIFVVVSPDGATVFSRAWDEPVKLWDLETGEKLGEFGTVDPDSGTPPAAAFHPTEPWLYAARGSDQIAIYTLDTDELMGIARSRLTRDFSEGECQLYLRGPCGEET
jgi:serine/threonine protein kinase/DNA-binding SARP family transcriptional activator/WD40 repeat protein